MTANARIEELRRRVQADPTSIAFAALAEEYRRAGRYEEAIDVCRSGLTRHPAYISARVTLGRALVEVNQLDEAAAELEQVLKIAPENLTATRTLTEIAGRRSAEPATPAEATPLVETRNGFTCHSGPVPPPANVEPVQPAPAAEQTMPLTKQSAPARTPIPVSTAAPPVLPPASQPAHGGVVERLQHFLNDIRAAKAPGSDRATR